MPNTRSSVLKENLCETKKAGNFKGWLGADPTKQFLISKVFRGGFWKYRLQIQDGQEVSEAAAAVVFQGSGDSYL
jgi:hypothetical protein